MTVDAALEAVFQEETVPLLDELETRLVGLERGTAGLTADWRSALGALHTIKGNCAMVERVAAQGRAHALEHALRETRNHRLDAQTAAIDAHLREVDELRAEITGHPIAPREAVAPGGPAAAVAPTSHVRISADKLDHLLELSSDVAAFHQRVAAVVRRRAGRPADELAAIADAAARSIADLRRAVMELRLVPLRALIGRFERPIRDLARQTGKQVELAIQVGELAVDKYVCDRLGEPLLHILRNAVDHGIEAPRTRIRAGKPEHGTIAITASASGGVLTVTVRDDGAGLDLPGLAAAAAARGLVVDGLSQEQTLELVFAPEVSTAATVTDVSGRGVGLDQARRSLEAIGGAIEAASEPGQWTELRLRIPLALAVQPALVVAAGRGLYAVPFRATIEAVRLGGELDDDGTCVRWRGRTIPVCALDEGAATSASTCVVITRAGEPAAIVVDELVGYQDLMIRELDPLFGAPRGLTGAALLSDGRIALVVDPDALPAPVRRAA